MKKCKTCQEAFTPRFKTTEQFCSLQCAKSKPKRVRKSPCERTHAEWIKLLESKVNALIREIDKDCDCISGGKIRHGIDGYDAGHYHSVGAHFTLRFHLMNIYAQSKGHNSHKFNPGMPAQYADGLIHTFGADHYAYVESLKMMPAQHWTIDQLKEASWAVSQCMKVAKKLDKPLSAEARLEVRRDFQKIIGLYTEE